MAHGRRTLFCCEIALRHRVVLGPYKLKLFLFKNLSGVTQRYRASPNAFLVTKSSFLFDWSVFVVVHDDCTVQSLVADLFGYLQGLMLCTSPHAIASHCHEIQPKRLVRDGLAAMKTLQYPHVRTLKEIFLRKCYLSHNRFWHAAQQWPGSDSCGLSDAIQPTLEKLQS